MQSSTIHARLRIAAVAIVLPLALIACAKLQPNGGNPTMTLLRDGSKKVCVAQDVLDALRGSIVPKAGDLSTTVSLETRNKAIAAINLNFEQTSLQSFDEQVTKATCSTVAALSSPNGRKADEFRVSYAISPAADDANSFVVTPTLGATVAFVEYLISDEMDAITGRQAREQDERQAAASSREVLAIVNPRWLSGAWIHQGEPSSNCGDGTAVWFEQAGGLTGVLGNGRWSLNEDMLHLVADKDGDQIDIIFKVTQADATSITLSAADKTLPLRRCTRAEIETLPGSTDDQEGDL